MKTPLHQCLLTAACWLALNTTPYAGADTPDVDPFGAGNDPPKQIRVQLEFIDVAHEQFTDLLFGQHVSANDGELRAKAAALVKDGKASIVETMLCIARSGQKATTESIEEFIYPTEYEPAQMPEKVEVKPDDDQGKTGADTTKPSNEKLRIGPRDYATGPTPTAFETRNLGSTLEIEPTLSNDAKYIDLRFVPEIVYHVGNTVWAEWKDQYGSCPVQMPRMYVVRINTGVTLAPGQYCLVAAVSPKGQDGFPDFSRKLMIFVKADVLTVSN
jgi:hypothetical protein